MSSLTSHTRRRQKGHVARPPNAFMLFRSIFWANEKLKDEPIERDHRDISRIAAHCWNSLDDVAKDPYRALALQRKLQHGLEHPDYKYRPAFPRERLSKRKVKKSDDAEEERCKKLASLVMDGVSSAGIREAMKGVGRKPPHGGTSASRPRASRARRRASKAGFPQLRSVKEGSPSPKVESPFAQVYSPDNLGAQPDDGFVPTEEIPYLELSPVKKEEETFTIQFDPSIQLPTHKDLDSHFGIKPMQSGAALDSCFWNTQDDMTFGVESDLNSFASLSEATDQLYGPVTFTDPFDDYSAGSSHSSPMWGQGSSNIYPSPTAMNGDPTTHTYDSDMNEYFHFDY